RRRRGPDRGLQHAADREESATGISQVKRCDDMVEIARGVSPGMDAAPQGHQADYGEQGEGDVERDDVRTIHALKNGGQVDSRLWPETTNQFSSSVQARSDWPARSLRNAAASTHW